MSLCTNSFHQTLKFSFPPSFSINKQTYMKCSTCHKYHPQNIEQNMSFGPSLKIVQSTMIDMPTKLKQIIHDTSSLCNTLNAKTTTSIHCSLAERRIANDVR